MSADRPWEAGPFSAWVIKELNSRINSLSSGIAQSPSSNNGVQYLSGPRRHWIRTFSNGLNKRTDNNREWGLILKSPDIFYNQNNSDVFSARYGISPNQQVYGFSNIDQPKFITANRYRINVPEPGIVSFTVDVQKNFFATGKINWVCHSIDQLNAITPYFLTPLITVFVEWGWNNFDVGSLIDYSRIDDLSKIVENHFDHYETKVPISNGNYEFMVGDVTNFEYSFDDNVIKGFTEIRSRQMLYSGFNVRGGKTVNVAKGSGNNGETETPALSFRTSCEQILQSLALFSENNELPIPPDPVNNINGITKPKENPSQSDKKGYGQLLNLLSPYTNKYGPELNNLPNYIYKFPSKIKNSAQTDQNSNNQNGTLDSYITMELFVDIINSLKNQNTGRTFLKDFFEVDVNMSTVGYHKNLISTSRNVLIPNPDAPKFNGKASFPYSAYKDDPTTFNGEAGPDGIVVKKGQFVDGNSMKEITIDEKITLYTIENDRKNLKTNPSDVQLKLLVGYNKNVFRNNLNFTLNAYGRSLLQTRNNTGFGSGKYGELKNVYINLNYIIESIVVDEDVINMKDMYDKILKELNESVCDFWNLEIVNTESSGPSIPKTISGNRLQIADTKYEIKTRNIGEIFTFEYGSDKSIIKKINFTTSLTNAMANQILYRSFGQKSLSSNNLIDFSNEGMYVDRIKDDAKNKTSTNGGRDYKYSDQLLSFASIISKYLKFEPSNPDASFLLRVQVFQPQTPKEKEKDIVYNNYAGAAYYGMGGLNPATAKLAQPAKIVIPNFEKYNIVDLFIPDKEALVYLLNDNDRKGNPNVYCAPIRNVELEISLMGIAGIRVFEYFKVKNLPPPFTDDVVVFQVRDVNHTIDENGWETRIKASVRPAYNLNPV